MNANSMILFVVLAASCPAQDPAAAARKFAERDYAGARAEYDKAAAAAPEAAEWQYDRALAAFRAGDLDTAVDAIERYAAMPGGGRADLHHGLLGNVRFLEAKALQQTASGAGAPPGPDGKPVDPVTVLEGAVEKAKAARDAYVRAAAAPAASPALARNAERAVRLLRELEQQLDEAKKQREQQQKDDSKKDDSKKDEQKSDDQKQDEQKQDDQKSEDQQKDDQKSDAQEPKESDPEQEPKGDQKGESKPEPADGKEDAKPEPKPTDSQPSDPKDGEQKPEPKPAQSEPGKESGESPRGDAPGEQQGSAELSPEQRARLLELLEKQDQQLKKIRAAAVRGRRPVERDW